MSLGSSGSQTTVQNQEPMRQTPYQSRSMNEFYNYLFGGSPRNTITTPSVTMPSFPGMPDMYGTMPSITMPYTTGEPTIAPYKTRLAEDIVAQEAADRELYGTSQSVVDKYLGDLMASLGSYKTGLEPMMDTNRPTANAAPITLKLGDFGTNFVPGSQRYAQDYMTNTLGNILMAEQALAGEERTHGLGLAELLAGINKKYTPNLAENKYMDYMNQLFQADENRRYGMPTITTTETADNKPGLLSMLGTAGALAGGLGLLLPALGVGGAAATTIPTPAVV